MGACAEDEVEDEEERDEALVANVIFGNYGIWTLEGRFKGQIRLRLRN